MTALEKMFSKDTLTRIDRFRRERGLRTRKQALEVLIAETVPKEAAVEHPLLAKLRAAPKAPKGSVSPQVITQMKASHEAQARGEADFVSLEQVKADLAKKAAQRAR
jgi:hypothetical protein